MPDLKRLESLVEMLSMIDRGDTVAAKSLAAHFGVTELKSMAGIYEKEVTYLFPSQGH